MKPSALDDICSRIDDGEALRASLIGPFRRAIRLHPLRGNAAGWGDLDDIPWSLAGRLHADEIDPGSRLGYHCGQAYPQDAASQLPVCLLDPQPGEIIVDCCAAPGSKSTQIGLALADRGLLICCDASQPRRKALRENLARQGIACGLVTPLPLERLAEKCLESIDALLVDAPCSGHVERSLKQVARAADRQLGILRQAAAMCRSGGRIVYSTCTAYCAENEEVVQRFLDEQVDWQVDVMAVPGTSPDLAGLGAIRLWPQRQGTEPFFACRLRRGGDARGGVVPVGLAGRLPAAGEPMISGLHCWEHGGRVFAATPESASCALPSEARGVLIGKRSLADADVWAVQAMIERGAEARCVSHDEACRLWAGEELAGEAGLLKTDDGLPLAWHDGQRLRLPSRMCRQGLL